MPRQFAFFAGTKVAVGALKGFLPTVYPLVRRQVTLRSRREPAVLARVHRHIAINTR